MFLRVGNEKKFKCVRPIEILDVNQGINVVDFVAKSATQSIILKTENGLNILCKSQDYKEYIDMIKIAREAVKERI